MSNEIVRQSPVTALSTMNDVERAAKAMVQSGFFQDAKQASQAIVKILAGQELGFGPFASMTGVHIIQNKPTLAANLMAAAVKRTGKYNYRVAKHTDQECVIDFYEGGEKVGSSSFTVQDAAQAGLSNKDNWKKYPRNLLFARALSNGQKWYAPDVFNGATVYTPEELGAEVDGEGNVINATATDVPNGNPDPIDDKAREAWEALKERGAEVGITLPEVDFDNTTKAELRVVYKEQEDFIRDAEDQAAAE